MIIIHHKGSWPSGIHHRTSQAAQYYIHSGLLKLKSEMKSRVSSVINLGACSISAQSKPRQLPWRPSKTLALPSFPTRRRYWPMTCWQPTSSTSTTGSTTSFVRPSPIVQAYLQLHTGRIRSSQSPSRPRGGVGVGVGGGGGRRRPRGTGRRMERREEKATNDHTA